MRKKMDRIELSEEKKEHYKKLGIWLKENPEISFKKLSPIGYSINVSTVSKDKVEEFLQKANFNASTGNLIN